MRPIGHRPRFLLVGILLVVAIVTSYVIIATTGSPSRPATPSVTAIGRCEAWITTGKSTSVAGVQQKAQAAAASPCQGNSWVFDWARLQPTATTFDWTLVDAAIADSAPKHIFIRVNEGVRSPAWVMAQTKNVTVPGYGLMPVPWDATNLRLLHDFLVALGHRYDGNASVAMISTCPGGVFCESYLPGGKPLWVAAGYTYPLYLSTVEQIAEYYVADFVKTPLVLNISIGVGPGADNPMLDLIAWINAKHPTIYAQTNGLTGTNKQGLVAKAKLYGLQVILPDEDPRVPPLCGAFRFALQIKVTYLEVYYADVTDASDAGQVAYYAAGNVNAPCPAG